MGQTTSKLDIIKLVIQKFGRYLPIQDRDDMRQELELCLFEFEKNNTQNIPPGLIYDICRKRAISWLKKLPPRMEDIDDPDVLRKYDKQISYTPDIDTGLDAEKAVHFVNSLHEPHKTIIIMLFGIGCDAMTEDSVSKKLGKSQQWVSDKKTEALNKLRMLMERKGVL